MWVTPEQNLSYTNYVSYFRYVGLTVDREDKLSSHFFSSSP